MKIRVNRKKWNRGKTASNGLYYNGKFCIIPFIAKKVCKITFKEIADKYGNESTAYVYVALRKFLSTDPSSYYLINDRELSDQEIEATLTKLAKVDNIELEFYN